MKVKLLLISLICTQSIYGSDVINLLQEANKAADDLVGFVKSGSIKPNLSLKTTPVLPAPGIIDPILRYPNIKIPILSPVVIPAGGEALQIYNYELLYPVVGLSAPEHIQHSDTHLAHDLITIPVLQQGSENWQGAFVNMGNFDYDDWDFGPKDMGGFFARDKIATMEDLELADGLNCGYHALKNVIFMLAACKKLELGLNKVEVQNLLYRTQDIQSFIQLLTPWLQFVIPYRYKSDIGIFIGHPLGDYPSGTELEKLLDLNYGPAKNQPLIPQDLENVFDDGLHSHILILDSFSYLTNPTDKYLTVLENIVNHENGLYGFVVNDAACEPLDTARGNHWFGYVLWKKDGKSTWLYTDSIFNSHDQVTSELLHICSQTPAEFKVFLTKRVDEIRDELLRAIESKLDRLNNSAEAYEFKFRCFKRLKLGDCIFTIDDFKEYNTSGAQLVDDALVVTFNNLWQAKLRSEKNVPVRDFTWQFSFWQRKKDKFWKVSYLDKSQPYDKYVYFELPDGAECITMLEDNPDEVFAELLREPIGTLKWNNAIVIRIMKIVNSTINYMIAHKASFASQYNKFKVYVDRVFEKISIDLGPDLYKNAKIVCEIKLQQIIGIEINSASFSLEQRKAIVEIFNQSTNDTYISNLQTLILNNNFKPTDDVFKEAQKLGLQLLKNYIHLGTKWVGFIAPYKIAVNGSVPRMALEQLEEMIEATMIVFNNPSCQFQSNARFINDKAQEMPLSEFLIQHVGVARKKVEALLAQVSGVQKIENLDQLVRLIH